MYADYETKISQEYLERVIKALNEPICILGGWAVFLQVNKKFQQAQGQPYLGSRDIDLGFHFEKNSTLTAMKNSALAKTIHILEKELGFEFLSFRYLKEIHTETGKEVRMG